jgi:hypothetical protein
MNHEEHDELWELLGKARAPKERPFFAAKVLAAVREDASREPHQEEISITGWWRMIRRYWALATSTGVVAVIAVVFALIHQPATPTMTPSLAATDPLAPLAAMVENSDELATSLDNLIANQDNSIWLQEAPSSLY